MILAKMGRYLVAAVLLSAASPVIGMEVLVGNVNGANFVVEAEPEETLLSIQEKINAFLNTPGTAYLAVNDDITSDEEQNRPDGAVKDFWLDYALVHLHDQGGVGGSTETQTFTGGQGNSQGGIASETRRRKYSIALTDTHRKDIGFIVKTLSEKSIASILRKRSQLNEAGDRIQSVHPLRFLMCVFTDEKLKVDIENIKKRGWIWKDFVGGLKGSLQEESEHKNMKDEFVIDFAKEVGIDPAVILPSIHDRDWDRLVDLLIKHVPRKYNTKVFGT